MSRKNLLTKAGSARKRAPGAGRKPSGTVRVVGYVLQATADKIEAATKGCTTGQAIDKLIP